MTALLAEGGFLSDIAALITAVAGLVAGIFAVWRYLEERRKRLKAETRKREAEEKQKEAQGKQAEEHKQRLEAERRESMEHEQRIEAEQCQRELEDAVTQLERSLAEMQQLNAPNGEPMDDKIVAAVQQLITKVNSLTGVVNQLREEVDELKKQGSTVNDLAGAINQLHQQVDELSKRGSSGGGPKPIGPSPGPTPDGSFDGLRKQLEQAIAARRLSPDRQDRVVWNSPQGRIPVIIIRRGAQNHRVLFPDGTDDKVAVCELSPM